MSSGFISEVELAEQKRIRQEEWDKVRTEDQPAEPPEETESYDPRSLFERLQEQKQKRDLEYEEAHKLKNMIKGLDDDEVEFLDLVDRTKLEEERKKHLEEEKEMREFKAKVAYLQEKSLDERLKQELKKPQSTSKTTSSGSGRNSQHKLLAGVVVKKQEKSQTSESKGTKRKLVDPEISSESSEDKKPLVVPEVQESPDLPEIDAKPILKHPSALQCIGILPGLGFYDNSSDSDCSSDSDNEHTKYDLLGRKITKHENKS